VLGWLVVKELLKAAQTGGGRGASQGSEDGQTGEERNSKRVSESVRDTGSRSRASRRPAIGHMLRI